MAETYAESVIIGWKGVKDRDNKPLKFTKENVVKLLIDLPELFTEIQKRATAFGTFKERNEAANEKN